ncbi:GAF domain-containing protein, partial [Natronoarchaeum mannanilyticum]
GAATFADAAAAVREGKASERRFSVYFEGADGRRVGDVQLVPLPVDGADGTVGVIRDVTEREEYDRIVTALHDVSRRLFGADDEDEICAIAVEAAANLLDLELSGVWLLDEERNRLDPVAATARTHDEIGGLPHFAENEGLIWDVFRSGDAARYDDLREVDGVYNPGTPIRSELIVPIDDRGVLMAGEFRTDQFDDTDLELAGILASNVEAALDRTDRETLLRRRTEELERQRDRMGTVAAVLSRDIERR